MCVWVLDLALLLLSEAFRALLSRGQYEKEHGNGMVRNGIEEVAGMRPWSELLPEGRSRKKAYLSNIV